MLNISHSVGSKLEPSLGRLYMQHSWWRHPIQTHSIQIQFRSNSDPIQIHSQPGDVLCCITASSKQQTVRQRSNHYSHLNNKKWETKREPPWLQTGGFRVVISQYMAIFLDFSIEIAEIMENCHWKMMISYLKKRPFNMKSAVHSRVAAVFLSMYVSPSALDLRCCMVATMTSLQSKKLHFQ